MRFIGKDGYVFLSKLKIARTNKTEYVAVRLFSNRSQMTSKCGENKKVGHEAQPFYFKFGHFDRHENSTDVI